MACYWWFVCTLLFSGLAQADNEQQIGLAWNKTDLLRCKLQINAQEVFEDMLAPVECKDPPPTYFTPRPNGPPTQDELDEY